MIELVNVTKRFTSEAGPVDALKDFSLSVEAGQWVSVCGHSGSGKSTLLSLVGALATPTSGDITVAGRKLTEMNIADRALYREQVVGFVFQMFHLLPYLNVLDNVLVAARTSSDDRSKALELLNRFGLDHRLTHFPSQLSAGERQRTALARALLNDPPLLMADEPTGNLDPKNADEVLAIVDEFRNNGGTVLLATHDQTAAERGDRVIQLESGMLAAS